MYQTVTIFLAGIGGVFIGMTLLYVAILVTPVITRKLVRQSESK